jgi:hypothetical protein
MREDNIRDAIPKMSYDKFERFTRELLRRELYPGLNPTSPSHDLGEDARTEITTIFMHHGLKVSLAISQTTKLNKIRDDCETCKQTGRVIDVMVYVTDEDIQTDTEEKWRKEIKSDFGWDLEIRTLSWLAQAASKPEYESFVDDYLNVPPPGGDYIQTIETQFASHSRKYLSHINEKISGTNAPIRREEIDTIEGQLAQGRSIILTGEAGIGKSGIAAQLARNTMNNGQIILALDARNLGAISDELTFRNYLGLKGLVDLAVARANRYKGCRVIIDQLDNIVGTNAADILADFAIECSQHAVQIIVVCRNREHREKELLKQLTQASFVELPCAEMGDEIVRNVLREIGANQYSPEIVELGRNLLNLELIATIHQKEPDFDFTTLTNTNEVYLWECFIDTLKSREPKNFGEQVLVLAASLAKYALNRDDGDFIVNHPLPTTIQRLTSWGIINLIEGRAYRFRHEKFQDFIYSWDATERLAMPRDILLEIPIHKSRTIISWMDIIYQRKGSVVRKKFLQETLLGEQ